MTHHKQTNNNQKIDTLQIDYKHITPPKLYLLVRWRTVIFVVTTFIYVVIFWEYWYLCTPVSSLSSDPTSLMQVDVQSWCLFRIFFTEMKSLHLESFLENAKLIWEWTRKCQWIILWCSVTLSRKWFADNDNIVCDV